MNSLLKQIIREIRIQNCDTWNNSKGNKILGNLCNLNIRKIKIIYAQDFIIIIYDLGQVKLAKIYFKGVSAKGYF